MVFKGDVKTKSHECIRPLLNGEDISAPVYEWNDSSLNILCNILTINQQFVNVITFRPNELKKFWPTLMFRWSRPIGIRPTVQLPLLRASEENLSWYSVLNIFQQKVIIALKCWLNSDALCQNLLILNLDCWSYLNMSQGSGFLWDTVYKLTHRFVLILLIFAVFYLSLIRHYIKCLQFFMYYI